MLVWRLGFKVVKDTRAEEVASAVGRRERPSGWVYGLSLDHERSKRGSERSSRRMEKIASNLEDCNELNRERNQTSELACGSLERIWEAFERMSEVFEKVASLYEPRNEDLILFLNERTLAREGTLQDFHGAEVLETTVIVSLGEITDGVILVIGYQIKDEGASDFDDCINIVGIVVGSWGDQEVIFLVAAKSQFPSAKMAYEELIELSLIEDYLDELRAVQDWSKDTDKTKIKAYRDLFVDQYRHLPVIYAVGAKTFSGGSLQHFQNVQSRPQSLPGRTPLVMLKNDNPLYTVLHP